jgi:hypothetical protein
LQKLRVFGFYLLPQLNVLILPVLGSFETVLCNAFQLLKPVFELPVLVLLVFDLHKSLTYFFLQIVDFLSIRSLPRLLLRDSFVFFCDTHVKQFLVSLEYLAANFYALFKLLLVLLHLKVELDDFFCRVFFSASCPFVKEGLAARLLEPLQHLLVELDFLDV